MSGPDLLLPEGSVLLHIGPRKTGTTTIQSGLADARDRLGEYGVAYPRTPRNPDWVRYDRIRAATPSWAVARSAPPGYRVPDLSVWERFAAKVREATASGQRVCVSSETFGGLRNRKKLERIVTDLGGANVHVLATSRALHKLLPSHWQQQVKVTVDERSYDDWLRIVLGPDRAAADRAFWGAHDVALSTRAWVREVGPERFTLIVTDDSDRTLLPSTVAAMLGIPADLFADRASNRSLAVAETEVLRELNQTARDEHWSAASFIPLQRGVISGLRRSAPEGVAGGAPQLPAWALPLVVERSEAQRALIADLGVRVIGDPACLVPADQTAPCDDDAPTLDALPLASAVGAVSGTMRAAYRLDDQRRRQLDELRRSYDEAVAQRVRRAPLRELLLEIAKRPLRRMTGRAERPTDWATHAPIPPPVEATDQIAGRDETARPEPRG